MMFWSSSSRTEDSTSSFSGRSSTSRMLILSEPDMGVPAYPNQSLAAASLLSRKRLGQRLAQRCSQARKDASICSVSTGLER